MPKVCLLNKLSFTFNNIDEWNNNNLKDELIITNINQSDKNKIMQDIIYLMLNYSNEKFASLDTYRISNNYYMFTFHNDKYTKNDTIISYLIDNCYQHNYDDNNKYMHNNIAVIVKLTKTEILDVNKDEIINLIKSSNLHRYVLINDNITYDYYTNNPIYGKDEYNLFIENIFEDGTLRIHFYCPDEIVKFEDYNLSNNQNKELIKNILSKNKVLKNYNPDTLPINFNILISYHYNNINIDINEKLFNEIVNFLNK